MTERPVAAPAVRPPSLSAASTAALRREVFRLAWPAILEMCLHMAVWMFDVAMIGRLGAVPLSATAVGGQVYWGLMFLLGGIGVAVTAIVSRRVGEDDTEGASAAAGQGVALAVAAGLAMGLAIWAAAPGLFRLTRLGPEVSALGMDYLRVICRGAPFLVTSMVLSGILRGHGDTRTPMLLAALVNGLNILGDYVLIFGNFGLPALGVRGAALASFGAHVVGLCLFVGLLFGGRLRARVRPGDVFRFDGAMVRSILRLAVPASMENFLTDMARTVGVFAVATLGPVSMAAYEVTATTEAISFMPGFGFAVATTVLVGQSLGAGDPGKARAVVTQAGWIAVVFMGSLGVVFFLFPRPLVSIFTNDPAIIEVASRCLRVTAFAQPFIALHGVLSGALRGAGDTRSPMVVAGVTSWGCRVLLTYVVVLALGLPLEWVWGVMALDFGLKMFWLLAVYRQGRWQGIRV
ncbi:MAG TPA: hypothetical protein DGR79_02405 [Clostridiales bacterium]|nr:hypothetical protein [Clostridiales bacterium]